MTDLIGAAAQTRTADLLITNPLDSSSKIKGIESIRLTSVGFVSHCLARTTEPRVRRIPTTESENSDTTDAPNNAAFRPQGSATGEDGMRSFLFSFLLGALCGSAMAGDLVFASGFDERHSTGTHYVLVYQDGQNAWHTCSGNDHNYVEWTGYGTAIRSGCSFSHNDTDTYPQVYPLDAYTVWMDNTPTTCRYVASTGPAPGSGDTQVTIDCRTY